MPKSLFLLFRRSIKTRTQLILENIFLQKQYKGEKPKVSREVIALIKQMANEKEIAQKLQLFIFTVKSHVHNILEKLALHTRVQIASQAHNSDFYKTAIDTTSLINE
jgi:DNA-binding NarL/FixJ family response regulator